MKQSPLFLKSFEMLTWLLDHTRKFPKHQRFVMAKRMEEAALGFHDEILWAVKSAEGRAAALGRADYHLERLKVYNRLSRQLKLSSFGQYEHLARMLDEMGRLLGGWLRADRNRRGPQPGPGPAAPDAAMLGTSDESGEGASRARDL